MFIFVKSAFSKIVGLSISKLSSGFSIIPARAVYVYVVPGRIFGISSGGGELTCGTFGGVTTMGIPNKA